ncbi:MAG TPA: hypothetical protein VM578_05135 [Candidatus Saccharimonadales bacterium]|nr:hypothetical protein [Candidatus Saccharimonadales bacterium]
MDHWGAQFANAVEQRGEGQSDFALDLIDLLQQKAEEFNEQTSDAFKFPLQVTSKGEDVAVTNGYKTVAANSTSLPGAIFIRVWNNSTERAFEGTLHNTPNGFEADGIPSECAEPSGLAEWMIHEVFEP